MLVSAIGHYPVFRTITEENRKPPVESEQQPVCVPQPPIHKHPRINPVSVTGWVGVGALATAISTGMSKSTKALHKIAAFIAVAAVAAHIGMVNARHNFFKHIANDKQG